MKKLFALILALSLLFLTACNTKPSVDGSTGSKKPNVTEDVSDWKESLRDQIITKQYDIFDLSSRIVFQIGSDSTYYYSKADGKAYIYCYDPICDHTDYTCLANPGHFTEGFGFTNTAFINDRFWCVTLYGKIYSFSFDGSDKKLEYDADGRQKPLGRNDILRSLYLYSIKSGRNAAHFAFQCGNKRNAGADRENGKLRSSPIFL